jgi:valyl-tRNA synthetase
MSWPDNNEDSKAFFLEYFFETRHDILFFWVARMITISFKPTNKLLFH